MLQIAFCLNMIFSLLIVLILLALTEHTYTRQECSSVVGQIVCKKDARRVLNSEISLIDRDGKYVFDLLDRDDLMGRTYPDANGRFRVEGCAGDHDWIPLYANRPEPYLEIYHYCNDEQNGEVLRLPEFSVFAPHTYVMEEPIVLDDSS